MYVERRVHERAKDRRRKLPRDNAREKQVTEMGRGTKVQKGDRPGRSRRRTRRRTKVRANERYRRREIRYLNSK